MPGPVEEGSIVGYLRLNDSDWKKTLDEAEAYARATLTNPDIHIEVSGAAEAIAKLEAVKEAKDRVGGTTTTVSRVTTDSNAGSQAVQQRVLATAYAQADAAIERLRIDQEADNATMRRGAADALRETAAMEALAASERKATDDAIANIASRRSSTSALVEEAAAVDGERAATNNANQAHQGTVSRMGLIVGAIAAAIPLGAALAGTTVAIAGGLAGMGAAGVLAFLGIRNAMASGTAVGNQYAAGIQILLADLHKLEATATAGVLKGFEASLSNVSAAMPALNTEIGQFSSLLGTTASFLVRGIITAFEVMNPLFVQAGVYVEQLAVGFQRWTSDGGLAQFTQMAIASLPQVTAALGSLVKGALDLVGALAPLGIILLSVITVLGQLLSLIAPVAGALVPLAAAAGVVYAAFLLWKNIAPNVQKAAAAIRGFGLDLSVMGGVAGLAVAALGYIASSFVTARMASSQAAQALQDYTAAVQEDNGVIGENVRQQTAKALADKNSLGQYNSLGKSAIDIGRQLGLSARTVADASSGQYFAILKVNKAMTDYAANPANSTAKVAAFRANWVNLTGVIADNQVKIHGAIKSYNDIASAQGTATISTKAQLKAQQDLASRYNMSLPAFLAAEGAQKKNADQAAATTQQLQFENDAATLLTNAFTLLNGGLLSVAQAQTGAAAASNTLLDSFKQNGLAINGNTKAAVANQQAIEQKVVADQQAAEAIAKQTGSTQSGTKAFAASKVALENQLRATHNLTPAIQAYINKLYAIPPVVKTKAELDIAAAKAAAAQLQRNLDAITRVITIHVNTVGAVSGPVTQASGKAHGGLVAEYHANGGAAGYLAMGGSPFQPRGTDTVPTMLTPGEFVIKQPSAAYNPPFLKAYNDNPRAATAALQAQGAPQVHHHHQWTVYASDPEQLYQGFMNRINSRHV